MNALLNSKEIRILIADDHAIFRNGLRTLLKKITGIRSVMQAGSGEEVLSLLSKEKIDIVLMDIEMPLMDGIEATHKVKTLYPDVKVIVLTMFTSQKYILELYDAGVNGYLLKSTGFPELERAIGLVRSDEQYFCKEVSEILYKVLLKRDRINKDTNHHNEHISTRGREILQLICDQYSSEEIATKLFISPKTVKRHRQVLIEKTGSKNLAGLVVYAIRNDIYKVYPDH